MLVESNKQTTKNIKNVLNAYSRHFAKKIMKTEKKLEIKLWKNYVIILITHR